PALKSKTSQDLPIWRRERILPLRSPFATTVWDYINRGMPAGREGTLKPDEVYALTAYLLFVNKVIPEDTVLDETSLPKVKMPNSVQRQTWIDMRSAPQGGALRSWLSVSR